MRMRIGLRHAATSATVAMALIASGLSPTAVAAVSAVSTAMPYPVGPMARTDHNPDESEGDRGGGDAQANVDWDAQAVLLNAMIDRTRSLPQLLRIGMGDPSTQDEDPLHDLTDEVRGSLDDLFAGAESYAMVVRDARTGYELVNINGGRVSVSASTYKLYVARDMATMVESGALSWQSGLNGMTLESCLDTMIVNSDNDCPIAWLTSVSSNDETTARAVAAGASGTVFGNDGIVRTTADDLSSILEDFYHRNGLTDESADRILALMERQIYREGIPAAFDDDVTVADKVGFLDAYLNDAGIVYSAKGDLIVVVLTNGSSWDDIAQAVRIVYQAL